MDAIVKFLEKHQPLFDKISRNIYGSSVVSVGEIPA